MTGFYLVGLFDAYEGLSQGHGAEAAVKEEEAHVGVDPEELGHVDIVREGGGQADHADHRLARLHQPAGDHMRHGSLNKN